VNKIAGQLNPVEFPEDDIFGYMRAQEGQGRRRGVQAEDDGEEEEAASQTKAVMRASPFAASLLVSLRSDGWRGEDEGFVHLTKFDPMALAQAEVERFLSALSEKKEDKKKDVWNRLQELEKDWSEQVKSAADNGDLDKLRTLLSKKAEEKGKEFQFIENATSPLPYTTRFYNTNLQAVFCLDYSRMGVFWNVGDRIELEGAKVKKSLEDKRIEDVTKQEPYRTLTQDGKLGQIYRLVSANNTRKERAAALLKALAVLRGGAKQAQFGTDVSPKVLILAGLTCGNPIFNHLFLDNGEGPVLKVDAFKQIIRDYADRIVTPILLGFRAGYLRNEAEATKLAGWWPVKRDRKPEDTSSKEEPLKAEPQEGEAVEVKIGTPIEAARSIGELLP
jgi:hypothetical protein